MNNASTDNQAEWQVYTILSINTIPQSILTIVKILLDDQFVLLLISSTDDKIILTANKPVELFKPASKENTACVRMQY